MVFRMLKEISGVLELIAGIQVIILNVFCSAILTLFCNNNTEQVFVLVWQRILYIATYRKRGGAIIIRRESHVPLENFA